MNTAGFGFGLLLGLMIGAGLTYVIGIECGLRRPKSKETKPEKDPADWWKESR